MADQQPAQPGVYELPIAADGAERLVTAAETVSSLSEPLLTANVLWFCRLRWIVVGALAAMGLAALAVPGLFNALGLNARAAWPLALAAVLAVSNAAFLSHARTLRPAADSSGNRKLSRAAANLWTQIALDLVVLTLVVHFLGSLETYAAFAYLFHIVLACVFFSKRHSFGVVALATSLYVLCVVLELLGLLPPASLYANGALREAVAGSPGLLALSVGWAVGTWVVVWYLTSRLSELVRLRDAELARTNRRLREAQLEKTRHMLRTTHELKAPFAAIHANAQLLLRGVCGKLPAEATQVVARISARCGRLSAEIAQMLQLANLRTAEEEPLPPEPLDLAGVIGWCVNQAEQTAAERSIRVEAALTPVKVMGVEDHLKMMFQNLIHNAVVYSQPHGRVRVTCVRGNGRGATVTIEDDGIGIVADKLPHIFKEYYRTDEAARYNKQSTGLGLAIVAYVARAHGIGVRVESKPGRGTKFTLQFPSAPGPVPLAAGREEEQDGIPVVG